MNYEKIPGWFDFPSIYDQAVANASNKSILIEVGVAYGKSINYLASKCKENGIAPKIYAVDLFLGTKGERKGTYANDMFEQFVHNVHACKNNDLIETIIKDSSEAASDFKNGSIDFVFIDAAHDYESVKKDLIAWLPKVKKTGMIAGHDIDAAGVYKAVEEVIGKGKFEIVGRSWVKL
jgi:predicted O-methyltransferase YrrM